MGKAGAKAPAFYYAAVFAYCANMGLKVGFKRKAPHQKYDSDAVLLVEARGIEPLSESRFTETSPSSVYLLKIPPAVRR